MQQHNKQVQTAGHWCSSTTVDMFVSQRSKKLFDDVCQAINANNNKQSSSEKVREDTLDESSVFDGIKCFMDSFKDKDIPHEQTKQTIPSSTGTILHTVESSATTSSVDDPHPQKRDSDSPFDPLQLTGKRPRIDSDVAVPLDDDVMVQPPPLLNDQELDNIGNGAEFAEGVCKDDATITKNGGSHLELELEVEEEESKIRKQEKDNTDESKNGVVDQSSFIDSIQADIKVSVM